MLTHGNQILFNRMPSNILKKYCSEIELRLLHLGILTKPSKGHNYCIVSQMMLCYIVLIICIIFNHHLKSSHHSHTPDSHTLRHPLFR